MNIKLGRVCAVCGTPIYDRNPNANYCKRCVRARQSEYGKIYRRKYKEKNRAKKKVRIFMEKL